MDRYFAGGSFAGIANLGFSGSVTHDGKEIKGAFPGSGISIHQNTNLAYARQVGAHEIGHYFYGSGHFDYIGAWGIFDGLDGSVSMSGYERLLLNWVTPTVINLDQTVTISDAATNSDYYRININATDYFLLENRQQLSIYEQQPFCSGGIPGTGLLISHIRPNASQKIDQLRWEAADGTFSQNGDAGEATDTYKPGNKIQFTPWTDPNSDDVNGTNTGIAITNIRQLENDIRVDIDLDFSGGEITEDSWWEGTETVTGDIEVVSGATLTVEDNTTVNFSVISDYQGAGAYSTKSELIVWGTVLAEGDQGLITFTRSGGSGSWGDILIRNGGSGTITHATIEHASKGVFGYFANNMTIENCTIQNFTEQAIYCYNTTSGTVQNNVIRNGGSHGIYFNGSTNPTTVTGNSIENVSTGIEDRTYSQVPLSDNTIKNCTNGIKTFSSDPEIFNNYIEGNDYGIRITNSLSVPDIHDNNIYDNIVGLYAEQGQPAEVKWNNFGYNNGQYLYNTDAGILVNYLQSGNNLLDDKWNNFYDGYYIRIDVWNQTSVTLNAEGNYWEDAFVWGPVDRSPQIYNANPDAGPGGALSKIAIAEKEYAQQEGALVPTNFALQQNFPNPFNPNTVIRFDLPEESAVTLIIFDVLGRHVRTLVAEASYGAGVHRLTWNGTDDSGKPVASGVYIYRIEAQPVQSNKTFSDSRKIVFIQ